MPDLTERYKKRLKQLNQGFLELYKGEKKIIKQLLKKLDK